MHRFAIHRLGQVTVGWVEINVYQGWIFPLHFLIKMVEAELYPAPTCPLFPNNAPGQLYLSPMSQVLACDRTGVTDDRKGVTCDTSSVTCVHLWHGSPDMWRLYTVIYGRGYFTIGCHLSSKWWQCTQCPTIGQSHLKHYLIPDHSWLNAAFSPQFCSLLKF